MRVINAALISIIIVVSITFGLRPFAFSRLLFFYDGVLIVFTLSLVRAVRRQVEAQLRQHGVGPAEIERQVRKLGLDIIRPRHE